MSPVSGLGRLNLNGLGYLDDRARMSPERMGYWTRRLWRSVGILAVALVVHLAVMQAIASSDGRQLLYRLSMATGYASVVLIAWAMLIGPWRVRRGRPAPASTDLRRDVGIWGGLFGLAHVVTGLQVHFAGKFWKYFLYPDGEHVVPLRHDLFGFANWTGLAAGLLLVLLLAISNDLSLRALGTRRWKAWQRWTYWAAALTVAHALAYQIPTKNHARWIVAFLLVTVIVLAMQLDGRRRYLARREARASSV
jgi:sulfoxide reductase heme-binding subunit YedZ